MDISETKETVRLMQGIAQQGTMHLRELDGDFSQLRDLLAVSIDRITASFMHISHLATLDGGERPADALAAAARLEEIAMTATTVATELQFHDLSTQILARSAGRVNGLHNLLSQLGDLCIHLEFEESERHRAKGIATASEQMMHGSQELATRLRKTVQQKNLDVGDIELF